MGNYKFRFSDMMPNAWFYKLKGMSSTYKKGTRNTKSNSNLKKKQTNSTAASTIMHSPKQREISANFSDSRKSYYFTRDPIANFETFYNSLSNPENKYQNFLDPPRKSAKQGLRIKARKCSVHKKFVSNSSVTDGCICQDFSPKSSVSEKEIPIQQFLKMDLRSDESLTTQTSNCVCKSNSDEKDIIIDFKIEKKIDLPPILTKPTKTQNQSTQQNRASSKSEQNRKFTKMERFQQQNSAKKFTSNYSPGGMRLRAKSPRIANITTGRKSVSSSSSSGGSRRNNISDSFAVVKSSFNPQKDFKESMMEMIVENNIRASKDLEELLACYLSLNSDEYHDLIIKVFKQIWFDLIDMQGIK